MKGLKFLFLIAFLLAASCCKDELPPYLVDGDGVIISMPFHWKYSLHATPSNSAFGYVDVPVVYQKNILIHTSDEGGKGRLSMVSGETGKMKWNWNDIFQNTSCGDYQISFLLFYDNLITWQVGARSYCIDLENGTTHWRNIRNTNFAPRIHKYKNEMYFTTSIASREDGYDESVAYVGDIETGELSEFLRANYSCEYASPFTDNGWVGGIVYMNQVPSNDSLILVTYAEPLPEWQIKSFIGLYNTETQTWVYERKQLAPPHWNNSVFYTEIYNNRYYANVGNSIVCHDIATGENVWRKEFTQDFFFSGFIIEDGKLIANCEDTYIYRLDPETGSTMWSTKSAGTSGRMSYLNGVVYYVGGSTGYLHAVDTESGLKTVWRIDARRLGESEGSFTTNAVYCIPGEGGEKGKVIALSGRYAYCFEAYR